MSVVVVISQHLLNVFVQLANKRGFKKKKKNSRLLPSNGFYATLLQPEVFQNKRQSLPVQYLLFCA
jgi:hypothetical protein